MHVHVCASNQVEVINNFFLLILLQNNYYIALQINS